MTKTFIRRSPTKLWQWLRLTVPPILPTTLFFLSSGWLKDSLKGDELFCKGIVSNLFNFLGFHDCPDSQGWILGGITLLFFCSALWAFSIVRRHLPIKRLQPNKVIIPHKAMALSISLLKPEDVFTVLLNIQGMPEKIIYPNRGEDKRENRLSGNIDEDIKIVPHSTQQFLRALAPHVNTLQKLHLLGSSDTRKEGVVIENSGSWRQLDSFINLARAYCPNKMEGTSNIDSRGVDFEDAFAVYTEIGEWIQRLKATTDIKDDEIILDITSGQKPTSVGTALATLNNFSRFQYVQTAHPHSVVMYELTYQSQPQMKMG